MTDLLFLIPETVTTLEQKAFFHFVKNNPTTMLYQHTGSQIRVTTQIGQ
jgi:hypothetical protein